MAKLFGNSVTEIGFLRANRLFPPPGTLPDCNVFGSESKHPAGKSAGGFVISTG